MEFNIMENMFEGNLKKYSPLADRMRANTLGDFVGQEHLIYRNSFLVRAIENGVVGSCIFWGPPGCGKTTIANIIANTCNGVFKKLNAVSSGVGDAKAIIAEAKSSIEFYNKEPDICNKDMELMRYVEIAENSKRIYALMSRIKEWNEKLNQL